MGAVHIVYPEAIFDTTDDDDDNLCPVLAMGRGDFYLDMCCDGGYIGLQAQSDFAQNRLAQTDVDTVANQDFAVVYHCIRTSGFNVLHSFFFMIFQESPPK